MADSSIVTKVYYHGVLFRICDLMKIAPTFKSKIEKSLTHTKKFKTFRDVYKNFKYPRSDHILLPRSYGMDIIETIAEQEFDIEVIDGFPDFKQVKIQMEPIEFDENQNIVLNYLSNGIKNNDFYSKVLILPTGFGKSFIGLGTINIVKFRTLIVVLNKAQVEHWGKLLDQYYPDQWAKYKKPKEDKDLNDKHITVIIWNSYIRAIKNNKNFLKEMGFTIFDEIAAYCSKNQSEMFWNLSSRYVLGLTADEKREDGFEKIYYQHLGVPTKPIDLKGFKFHDENHSFDMNAKIVCYEGADEYTQTQYSSLGIASPTMSIGSLVADPDRNGLIVNIIMKQYEKNRNTIFFSEHRRHLEIISDLLIDKFKEKYGPLIVSDTDDENKEEVSDEMMEMVKKRIESLSLMENGPIISIPEYDINAPVVQEPINENECSGILYGGVKDVDGIAKKCSIILATYAFASKGLSIVKLDTEILGTPRKNGSRQVNGRIQRKGGDTTIPRKIYDIVDVRSFLSRQFKVRHKYYVENNYNIKLSHWSKYRGMCFNDIPGLLKYLGKSKRD